MKQTIAGIPVYEKYSVLIAAKTAAETTAPLELRTLVNYTFTSTTLQAGEEILVDIYDFSLSTPDWQPYMLNGSRVKLAKDYEQLQLNASSILVRFVKTATAAPVGLIMSHR